MMVSEREVSRNELQVAEYMKGQPAESEKCGIVVLQHLVHVRSSKVCTEVNGKLQGDACANLAILVFQRWHHGDRRFLGDSQNPQSLLCARSGPLFLLCSKQCAWMMIRVRTHTIMHI